MPRQDVPYGGVICRLKERIAEIWDELGKKLHSINGVEGDGQGDVKLVSGDPAVVITDDQVQHEIEISLDTSQLPAASVSSVNGQTGAVVLDASDINVIGGSDVATDLGNLDADLQQAQTDIATEALARANADSTLQGNINALSASIPTAAATAVANDPTVAQLATDVPNKVDKITSGSSLKAYTHTGATQGETSVVDGTTANSIGIRDANGRMQAADPASGATDKTLVTANWVSQTGSERPNNLIHERGNEAIYNFKEFTDNSYPRMRMKADYDFNDPNSLLNNVWAGIQGRDNANATAWEFFYHHNATSKTKQLTANLSKTDGSYNGLTMVEYNPNADGGERTYGYSAYSSRSKGTIYLESTTIDRDIIPTSGISTPQFQFVDKNGKLLGYMAIYVHQNGNSYFQIGMYKRSTGTIDVTDIKVVN